MDEIEAFCHRYGVARKNTSSLKWDALQERFGDVSLLPMWVADMEFKIPESAEQDLIERIKHGVFGYTIVPDSYYDIFFKWMLERHHAVVKKEWLRFATGVVNSFYWLVNALTEPGDSVIILTPVYYPFQNAVTDNKRNLITSELMNKEGRYEIDFADFEKKIIENQVKLFIHCSPHNPVGRVWKKSELEQLLAICAKHDVFIISDEIHQDIIREDVEFVSALAFEKYFERLFVLNSASKTFNLACLLHSHVIIPDENNRKVYDQYAKTIHQAEISVLGMVAAESCYRDGADWLKGLLNVVEYNYQLLKNILAKRAPKIFISEKEGTYLAWLDLSSYVKSAQVRDFVQKKCGLAVDYGEWFGPHTQSFIRINLATTPQNIQYAAEQIAANIV